MALQTSHDSPAAVRVVANLLGSWIDRLGAIWVEGQVASISPARPGLATAFLTLRDSVADVSIRVTAPRALVDSLTPPLVEGASVVVHAKPNFYANRGELSLAAREIRMLGLGELLAQLERRKQLLAAEGLFDPAHKQPLPTLPRLIGLVTAPQSAAERDVVENARRRWPAVRFEVAYAAMQGNRAAAEVIDALHRLDRNPDVDVIIVARGGGSLEDLLPFSDEGLIRAVAALTTPVVSAIGHEPDHPLLDAVADRRASTPTDAAKLVVPDVAGEIRAVQELRSRARRSIEARWQTEAATLAALRSRPALADAHWVIDSRAVEVGLLQERAARCVAFALERAEVDLTHAVARVRSLSPLATLERGYAVVQRADGTLVSSIDAAPARSKLVVTVADGTIAATTSATTPRTPKETS